MQTRSYSNVLRLRPLMSLVVKEVLRKCRFSAFAIIRPNIHERLKITQGWQLHLKLGCISPLLPCAQMVFSEAVCPKPPAKDFPEQSDLLPFPIPFCFFEVAFHTRRMNTFEGLFQHGEATAEKGREYKKKQQVVIVGGETCPGDVGEPQSRCLLLSSIHSALCQLGC